MFAKELTVTFPEGLHVGPCYRLAQMAKKYACKISIRCARGVFDAKSGMDLLKAGIGPGWTLMLICEGEGEREAGHALAAFLTEKLNSSN